MEDLKTAFVRTVFNKKSSLRPLFDIFRESVKDIILEDNSSVVDTACVQSAGQNKFLIRINRDFYKKKLTGKYDLFWVLIHELCHIVLGHFEYRGRKNASFINLCADINCNSFIFNLNYKKKLKVFEKFYKENYEKMIGDGLFRESRLCFLLFPPHKIRKNVEKDFEKIRNLSDAQKNKIISLWFTNYYDGGMPIQQIIHKLIEFVRNPETFSYTDIIKSMIKNPNLYGELAEKFSKYIEEYFTGSSDLSEKWNSVVMSRDKIIHKAEMLKRIIEKAVIKNSYASDYKNVWVDIESVIPNFSRRQLTLLNCGITPDFYPSKFPVKAKNDEFSAVYIDQSASMDDYKEIVYTLLRKITDIFSGPYFVFSTMIKKITLSDVKKNIFITGGTDIEPVISHINTNNFKKALIITDGYFRESVTKTSSQIYVVLTSLNTNSDSLEKSGDVKGVWFLDD